MCRLQHTARGCCVEGVEIYQGDGDMPGSEDLEMSRGRVEQMTDEDWQNRQVALRRGGRGLWAKARFKRGSVHTRLHPGACIFHNRIDDPAGAGCAFHVAAPRRGENPIDWKPRICWQVPLFFDIDDRPRPPRSAPPERPIGAGKESSTGGARSMRPRSAPISRRT